MLLPSITVGTSNLGVFLLDKKDCRNDEILTLGALGVLVKGADEVDITTDDDDVDDDGDDEWEGADADGDGGIETVSLP